MHVINPCIADIICYDDGCHLRKYCRNPVRTSLSEAAVKLAAINIVVDKLHFKGHIDPWCHANCNPYEVEDLKMVCMKTKNLVKKL